MAKEKAYNPAPLQEVPEVAAFEEVKARYNAFRESNSEFFKYLDALAEEYNGKRQAAEKAVRARQVSCGDFRLYQYSTKYDAEAAYNALGEQGFLQAGGKISTMTIHEIDKARFDAAVAGGQIPKEIADAIKKVSPKYKVPDAVEVP